MDFLTIIDILGTIAFAISGVLTAMHKRMDVFGILIIAAVTSVGGGTLRDVLIGKTPVTWMLDMTFIYVIMVASLFAVLFREQLRYFRRSLFLFDTIGIALYTTAGVQIGLAAELHPIVCVLLGTMSACFGGVLRDILCNEIPVIFRKEIYATACISGGIVYLIMHALHMEQMVTTIVSGLVVVAIRIPAVIFKWHLPSVYRRPDGN